MGYAGGMVFELIIETDGPGLYEITGEVRGKASRHRGIKASRGGMGEASGLGESGEAGTPSLALPQGGRESGGSSNSPNSGGGLCVVFVRHTSASILIQENADPSAKRDLERWLDRLVPEGDALYTHTAEGPDDMPAHVKAALTATSVAIPMREGELMLGTWQGIYLWEHRRGGQKRRVLVWVG